LNALLSVHLAERRDVQGGLRQRWRRIRRFWFLVVRSVSHRLRGFARRRAIRRKGVPRQAIRRQLFCAASMLCLVSVQWSTSRLHEKRIAIVNRCAGLRAGARSQRRCGGFVICHHQWRTAQLLHRGPRRHPLRREGKHEKSRCRSQKRNKDDSPDDREPQFAFGLPHLLVRLKPSLRSLHGEENALCESHHRRTRNGDTRSTIANCVLNGHVAPSRRTRQVHQSG